MLNRLYSWYGKKVVVAVIVLIALLVSAGIYFYIASKTNSVVEVVTAKSEVMTKKVSDIGSANTFSSIGTVQAISEARLQTEAGGRVTSVRTEIGKTVAAGTVLATIENANESATLLQAQGAYEAAVAGARSGQVSVGGAQTSLQTAQTNAITTFQNSYITVDTILHNEVDTLFSLSGGKAIGFKLNSKTVSPPTLNAERNTLETVVVAWAQSKNTVSASNIVSQLDAAKADTLRIASFIDILSIIATDQDASASFTEVDKNALEATLHGARIALNAQLQQLEGAKTTITASQKGLEQAQISGSSNMPSASSAQIKIALGSLRGAQANYEKTLIRTPISGVVNALYLKTGEYVGMSVPAAIVANNNGLEIETSVGEDDREKITIGAKVIIDGSTEGVITAVGGAIDPTTGKVAVKVSVTQDRQLKNGSTVSVVFTQGEKATFAEITIPLSSLKMTGAGPVAFAVGNDNKLTAIALELGTISGDSVVVKKGLTADSIIVVDARGLKEGQEVVVKQ